MLWIVLSLVASAACPEPFVFEGQPSCVALSYVDGRTLVQNRCSHAVWIDESVRLPGTAVGPLPAGAQVEVRDLSAFTLGMEGELFRAIARINPACEDAAPAAEPAPLDPAEHDATPADETGLPIDDTAS